VTNSYKAPSTINTVTKCLQQEAPPENDSYRITHYTVHSTSKV